MSTWQRANTDWLHEARWGTFVHYLADAPSCTIATESGCWFTCRRRCPATRANHLFLLDIRDVPASRGLPDYAADAGGPKAPSN